MQIESLKNTLVAFSFASIWLGLTLLVVVWESSVGWPLLTIVLLLHWLEKQSFYWKLGSLLFFSLLLSSLYGLPWLVTYVCLGLATTLREMPFNNWLWLRWKNTVVFLGPVLFLWWWIDLPSNPRLIGYAALSFAMLGILWYRGMILKKR